MSGDEAASKARMDATVAGEKAVERGDAEARKPRRTLLAAARRAGVRIGYPCRGEGICGRCVVTIIEGAQFLAPPDEEELLIIGDTSPAERLACMAMRIGSGTIRLRVGGGTYEIP